MDFDLGNVQSVPRSLSQVSVQNGKESGLVGFGRFPPFAKSAKDGAPGLPNRVRTGTISVIGAQ